MVIKIDDFKPPASTQALTGFEAEFSFKLDGKDEKVSEAYTSSAGLTVSVPKMSSSPTVGKILIGQGDAGISGASFSY